MLADSLTYILQPKPEEKEEIRQDIQEAIDNNKIKFIDDIGFFTWVEVYKNNKLHIYLNNLYILPERRNYKNLLFLRIFFRRKYPQAKFYYWVRDKKINNQIKEKWTYIGGNNERYFKAIVS